MRRLVIGACSVLAAASHAYAEPTSVQGSKSNTSERATTSTPEPATTVAEPVMSAAPVQQVAVLEPAPVQNILRSGTEIPLVIREELTTEKKKLRVG